jgi:hypothetical protein
MINLDGEEIKEVIEETYKSPTISPFDFANAIQHTKENLIVDEWSEKQYNPYMVNKALSFGIDTVIQANEMNSRNHLDKKLQFDFLINSIRGRKRYNKWIKPDETDGTIFVIKEYYKYNTEKARQAAKILTSEQLETIKRKLFKGGI